MTDFEYKAPEYIWLRSYQISWQVPMIGPLVLRDPGEATPKQLVKIYIPTGRAIGIGQNVRYQYRYIKSEYL